jgi:hypothetical protein
MSESREPKPRAAGFTWRTYFPDLPILSPVNESAELETKPEGGTTKYSKYTKI